MTRLLPLLFLLCSVLSSFAQTSPANKNRTFKLSAQSGKKIFVPGLVIVKLKEGAAPNSAAKTLSAGPVLDLKSATIESLVQKFPATNLNKSKSAVSRETDRIGLSRIYELRYFGDVDIATVINELLKDPDVEYAEPSYIAHIDYTPNDRLYSSQSYLRQVGAPQAWDVIKSSNGVIIGIVDSGSEQRHEDLSANVIGGYDLVGATSSTSTFTEDADFNVVGSANDHGVHVSGLASAVSNNGKGVASIASDAKLFIVKTAADDDPDHIYRGFDGIKYAADHGAMIINCSWGTQQYSRYEQDIVSYVISKGCLIVAAAGNIGDDGNTTPDYPAAYRGVLAVANVKADDIKSSSSKFGSVVALSAPGNNIISTTFSNSYGFKSGTSMATPIVSSAAALVKSYRPDLSMRQVGELLRVTADNIDSKNLSYAGKLGKGRLNVFRALTERTLPSVRIDNVLAKDDNGGRLLAGSIINVYLDLKNYLQPVSGLRVSLRSDDPNVSVSGNVLNVNSIDALETKTMIGPFSIQVGRTIPENSSVEFRVDLSSADGQYQDYDFFSLDLNLDYVNINTESLATTATSNGRIGYSYQGRSGGQGFEYKGNQLLYEASLMIGTSRTQVSNNTRVNENEADNHFVKTASVRESQTDTTVVANSEFDDSGNRSPLNITVRNSVTARKDAENSKYVIAEYEVINKNAATLSNVHVGLFNDWDISDPAANATAYDGLNRIAYAYSTKNGGAPYAGVKLLSSTAAPAYYPLSNSSGFLSDGAFTVAEKYQTLSSGVQEGGNSVQRTDVAFVCGYGPLTIPPNSSVKLAFAYAGGDNLQDLRESLEKAEQKYISRTAADRTAVLSTYPNPVTPRNNNSLAAVINLPVDATVSLDLYNVMGQLVKRLAANEAMSTGAHTLYYDLSDVGSGIYILRLKYNNKITSHKLSVVR